MGVVRNSRMRKIANLICSKCPYRENNGDQFEDDMFETECGDMCNDEYLSPYVEDLRDGSDIAIDPYEYELLKEYAESM